MIQARLRPRHMPRPVTPKAVRPQTSWDVLARIHIVVPAWALPRTPHWLVMRPEGRVLRLEGLLSKEVSL